MTTAGCAGRDPDGVGRAAVPYVKEAERGCVDGPGTAGAAEAGRVGMGLTCAEALALKLALLVSGTTNSSSGIAIGAGILLYLFGQGPRWHRHHSPSSRRCKSNPVEGWNRWWRDSHSAVVDAYRSVMTGTSGVVRIFQKLKKQKLSKRR